MHFIRMYYPPALNHRKILDCCSPNERFNPPRSPIFGHHATEGSQHQLHPALLVAAQKEEEGETCSELGFHGSPPCPACAMILIYLNSF
jgi:hypothetical protein